jgi:hypothetical protein
MCTAPCALSHATFGDHLRSFTHSLARSLPVALRSSPSPTPRFFCTQPPRSKVVHARSVPDGTILTFPRTLPSLLHTLSCFLTNELVHFRRELVALRHPHTNSPTDSPTYSPTPLSFRAAVARDDDLSGEVWSDQVGPPTAPAHRRAPCLISQCKTSCCARTAHGAHSHTCCTTRPNVLLRVTTFTCANTRTHSPHNTTPHLANPHHACAHNQHACSGKRPTNTHHCTTTTKPTRHVTTRTRTPGQPHNQLRRTAPHGTMDAHQHNTSHHPLHQPRRAHAQNSASTRRVCLYRLCAALRQ